MSLFKNDKQEVEYWKLLSITLFFILLITCWKYTKLKEVYHIAESDKVLFCNKLKKAKCDLIKEKENCDRFFNKLLRNK